MTPIYEKFKNPEEAMLQAQQIAFAPVLFQLARSLKNFGILETLFNNKSGLTYDELRTKIDLSENSLTLLLDGGESSGILSLSDNRYVLTLVGRYLLDDRLTTVNINFMNDVCYEGLFHLESSLRENKPTGLKVFGNWKTIYEHLTELPPKAMKSWFEFDHHYSDEVFPRALPILFKDNPKSILDVGGNTGKFAVAATQHNENVKVTILDHEKQLQLARQRAKEENVADRVQGFAMDLLDHSKPFPQNNDAIWMSQFLDCFSKEDILGLLSRANNALSENSYLYIMETFTDRQRHPIARFCLDMISFYFAGLANGNSRMYRATDIYTLLNETNFDIVEETNVGLSHTILKCRKKKGN